MPVPLVYNLGDHSLIITSNHGTPDPFELAAPVVDEETGAESPESPPTLILDHEETYSLYQCLHTLFHPPVTGE